MTWAIASAVAVDGANYSWIVPSGIVAPFRFALSSVASVRFVTVKSASVRFALSSVAFVRFAPVKSASVRFAFNTS